jgi:hypothetical protein
MPPIFINTDNSDKKHKIYIANAVGEGLGEAEDKMQAMVIKAFEKASEFTTNKIDNPKGYTLVFKVTKFDTADHETSCTINGQILQYPAVTYSKAKGSSKNDAVIVMTSGNWSGSATASGKGKRAMLDCVEAIMESMVPKSIPVMKSDMTRR